ncbi:Spy/CpxP family protein refolding chaperone [Mesorhizobium sp. KR1-2]|uniref:Spy/CpxP family protein refolding chaperone n=1 Tax=Mesorhizobium sp. KR1-2 TaxID=3156609 RepID=UPI0032B51589
MTAPNLAYAQQAPAPKEGQEAPNAVDWKEITDARIDVLKGALQLTPDQEKYWPAVEQAIRARAEARRARVEALAKMREERPDLFEILRSRADNMTQRAAGLKQLVDAWEPLYKTLDDKQKMRLRVVASVIMHEIRGGMEKHHMQREEEGYGDDDGGGDE